MFERLTRPDFDSLSRCVMGHVFASQNELGRLCDESVYQNDIALRLEAEGLGPVMTQLPVTVVWCDFKKTYSLDLVVRASLICELKAVDSLSRAHYGQLLHYLLLTDVPHGKLINCGAPSVEYHTVNAVVSAETRWTFHLLTHRWRPRTPKCADLLHCLNELLHAWGAFLDCHLYEEALIHFLGGRAKVVQRVPLARMGRTLGTQRAAMLTDDIAFRVTGLAPAAQDAYETHLRRSLAISPLSTLHWINFHHQNVQLISIIR